MFKYSKVQAFFTATVTVALVAAFFMQILNNHRYITTSYSEVFNEQQYFNKLSDGEHDIFFLDETTVKSTVFDKNLLAIERGKEEGDVPIFTSLENYIENNLEMGDIINLDGVEGVLCGLYFPHHPAGKNFYTVFAESSEKASSKAFEDYSPSKLPPSLAGINLLTFMLTCGLINFLFGLISLFFGVKEEFLVENLTILKYVVIFSSSLLVLFGIAYQISVGVIMWSIQVAIASNALAFLALILLWNIKRI
ncbi:hypothetical protein PRVXT_000750 [Proteinivorax tanatarense]|uniref:Uncharacterized protein n=1 Tax=Proteinivorax tanatarense TaxID=1260629 RepID=A0AAU7VN64_9FIRM